MTPKEITRFIDNIKTLYSRGMPADDVKVWSKLVEKHPRDSVLVAYSEWRLHCPVFTVATIISTFRTFLPKIEIPANQETMRPEREILTDKDCVITALVFSTLSAVMKLRIPRKWKQYYLNSCDPVFKPSVKEIILQLAKAKAHEDLIVMKNNGEITGGLGVEAVRCLCVAVDIDEIKGILLNAKPKKMKLLTSKTARQS